MYLTMNMNRSIKSLQAFDEELECVICTGRLLNAKFLQCLHSFCAECLERCVTVRGNLEGTCRLRSISCPLCREETIVPDNGIDGLKPNNLANKVVQALEGNDHCAKVMDSELCCESCRAKRSRAVAYCQDCRHFICRDCVGSHSSMKQILSGHRIKPLTDLRRSLVKTRNGYKDANHGKTCYQHNGQTKTHFCETCSMLICVRCVGDTHTEPHHMCVEAKDAVKSRLRSIQELVEQGHDKQKEVAESLRTIDRQRNEARRVIRRMQREINAAADAAAENALKSIDFQRLTLLKETDRLDEFLTGKYDELEAARLGVGSLLSNARSFGVKLMKNPSVNVLLTFDKLNTTLENLVSEQWDKASVDYIHNITQNVRFESQANTQWVSVGNLVDPNQWLLSRSIPISDVKDGEVSSMSYCSNGSLFLAHFNGVVDEMGIDGKLTHVLTTGSDIRDMAVLSDRTVVILDGTWQIAVYDPSGKKLHMIHPKNGSTGFTCLTADTNDMIFAGEFHRDTISVFGKDGSYVESIPAGGITPYRIVVTNSGKIVLSHSPASVSVLNRDGVVLCTIHRKQWQYALVCSDTKENIYILSGSRDEKKIISVHKYTLEGYIVECVVRHVEVDVGSWHPRIDCTPEGNLALVTKMKVDIYTTRSVIERERNEMDQENSEEKEMQLENSNS